MMDSEPATTGKNRLENIDPEGDVIMVVGPDKKKMRVNSHSLRLASKVFRVMLGPRWSEGRGLSRESPSEVTLEDDDVEAMQTIFSVLHFRFDLVPDRLAAEKVLDVAIACEKYDMISALRHTSATWLNFTDGCSFDSAGCLLTAAYVFDNAEKFKACSRDLVLSYTESYLDLHNNVKISQFLPFRAIYLLEQQRTRFRVDLAGIITAAFKTYCGKPFGSKHGGFSCDWGKTRRDKCIELLTDHGASTLDGITVRRFMDMLRHVFAADQEGMGVRSCSADFTMHQFPDDQRYDTRAEAIVKAAGLCLVCFQKTESCDSHK